MMLLLLVVTVVDHVSGVVAVVVVVAASVAALLAETILMLLMPAPVECLPTIVVVAAALAAGATACDANLLKSSSCRADCPHPHNLMAGQPLADYDEEVSSNSDAPLQPVCTSSSSNSSSSTSTSESGSNSRSNSSNSSSSDGRKAAKAQRKGSANLDVTMMKAMASEAAAKGRKESMYSKNATSKKRIKHALTQEGNKCKCNKRCWKKFTLARMLHICCTFWALAKSTQDSILWASRHDNHTEEEGSHDEDARESKARASRKQWFLDGAQCSIYRLRSECMHSYIQTLAEFHDCLVYLC
jgi:hypothetical protein